MNHPAPGTETDFAALMEEPPGGDWVTRAPEEAAGFGIIETTRGTSNGVTYGARDGGMTAHRGVLQADEYVDPTQLRALVAAELGFTIEQVDCAYKAGRPTPQRASIRAHIDARLLALSRSGGNMLELARALGWEIAEASEAGGGGANCRKLERALARGLAAEAVAA